mgnify:CR=1 FL=1
MGREYDDNQTLQQKIMTGANKLADNVASTLGPRGRNVLLQEKGKPPFITKDGVTVAAFVSCEDPFENAAAQIIKQAAVETNNNAGDGTTTATVVARSIQLRLPNQKMRRTARVHHPLAVTVRWPPMAQLLAAQLRHPATSAVHPDPLCRPGLLALRPRATPLDFATRHSRWRNALPTW